MQRTCADVKSPYKQKCWTNSGGPLVNSFLWYQDPRIVAVSRIVSFCSSKKKCDLLKINSPIFLQAYNQQQSCFSQGLVCYNQCCGSVTFWYGSGAGSVLVTNESGRPENIRILRIRILNTGHNFLRIQQREEICYFSRHIYLPELMHLVAQRSRWIPQSRRKYLGIKTHCKKTLGTGKSLIFFYSAVHNFLRFFPFFYPSCP